MINKNILSSIKCVSSGFQCTYTYMYEAMTAKVWKLSGSGPCCQSMKYTYEVLTSHCGRSVVHDLVVRVEIGVVIYEAMTPQCRRSVVHVLVVRVDIAVVIYEAMTPQCGRSSNRSTGMLSIGTVFQGPGFESRWRCMFFTLVLLY